MPVSYTCPNPDCRVLLTTKNPIAAGKQVKCPKCTQPFTPVPGDGSATTVRPAPAAQLPPVDKPPAADGTFKLADDGAPKKKPAAKPAPAPIVPPAAPEEVEESDASIKKGYLVVNSTEAEVEAEKKNKVKFGEVADKHKKSARGPAIALLVTPSNLMTGAGLLTAVGGLAMFVIGMWPLVFNDAPPGDEEVEEAIFTMVLGVLLFGMGAFVCFGTSQMQELNSYTWAMAGSVMAVPLLVGIYGIIMLMDPKVKAGFEEAEGGPDDDEKGDKDEDDDEDEDDEDDDDDDDDDGPKKGAKAKRPRDDDDDEDRPKKGAKAKRPRDDDDDEDEEEERKPKKGKARSR